jgi:hypothetical protein
MGRSMPLAGSNKKRPLENFQWPFFFLLRGDPGSAGII